jgi:hypothetical protein
LKTLPQELYNALSLKYEAAISDAKARIRIYFEHPVEVGGDYTGGLSAASRGTIAARARAACHLEEIDKLLDLLCQAEDKKSALERHFEQHQKIGI